jgi:hypothetical protein
VPASSPGPLQLQLGGAVNGFTRHAVSQVGCGAVLCACAAGTTTSANAAMLATSCQRMS